MREQKPDPTPDDAPVSDAPSDAPSAPTGDPKDQFAADVDQANATD